MTHCNRAMIADSERLVKPVAAFNLFQQACRNVHLEFPVTELARVESERWSQMGEHEQAPYRQKAAAMYDKYTARMLECKTFGQEVAWNADAGTSELPTKPRIAWNIFQAEANAPIVQAVAARWRSMVDGQQAWYRSRADADKKAYAKQMAEYQSSDKAASWANSWVERVQALRRAAEDVPPGMRWLGLPVLVSLGFCPVSERRGHTRCA